MAGERTKIGFIGLGAMGAPISERLVAAGFATTVWNRTASKDTPLVERGATVADSPKAVAAASEVVFTCVTDTKAVETVVFGPEGVAGAEGQGKLLIDHSSIHPEATRAFAARLKDANGMSWLDAPVSGGHAGAVAGTLAIMVGGSREDFARAEPLFKHTGKRITRMGDIGAGQTAKLCNQVIVGSTLAAIAEALHLAKEAGLDPDFLIKAMSGGAADSFPLQGLGPRMLEQIKEPVTCIDIFLKDLDMALDVGRSLKSPLPTTASTSELYRILSAQGHGSEELDAYFRFLGTAESGEGNK